MRVYDRVEMFKYASSIQFWLYYLCLETFPQALCIWAKQRILGQLYLLPICMKGTKTS